MPTTRKNIDFPDDLVEQMDAMKDERRVTYNEIVVTAVKEYFAPKPVPVPVTMIDRLDGIRTTQQEMAERFWGMNSVSQKTAERLAAIETHLEGLQGIVDKAMDLLILIGERLADAPVNQPQPMAPPVTRPPISETEEPPVTDILHDPRSQWYIPPLKPPEKRSWFRGNKS